MKPKERAAAGARRFGLGRQLVLLLLLCYLLPALVLGLFGQTVLLRGIQEKADAALSSEAGHAWTLTTQNIDRAMTLSKEAVYDEDLAQFQLEWQTAAISNAEYLRLCRNYLDRKYGRDSLFSFAAFVPVDSGGLFICNPSGRNAASGFVASELAAVLEKAETLDTGSFFAGSSEQLYLVRNLLNLRMTRAGTLILGIRPETLFAPFLALRDQQEGEIALLLDQYREKDAEWASLREGLTDLPAENRLSFVSATGADSDYELRFLLTLNREKHYRELYQFRKLSMIMLLLLIPLLLIIILYVHRRITRPIRLLADASRRIEAGELGITVPMHGRDELGELGSAFSGMSVRLKELIEKTYQEEIALRDARIQALQSRINPHFLNNALETINWEARMEGSETIAGMVAALSVLLNATLSRQNRRMVSLREELEVADGYIFFIRQRYADSVTIRREVEEAAEDCLIPLLTVQPVLENAVDHGIAPAGGGEITLAARRSPEGLRIQIINTGKPVTQEDRERIDQALSGDFAEGSHIGLANIARRLRLLYGEQAKIAVETGAKEETAVTILIPQDEIASAIVPEKP